MNSPKSVDKSNRVHSPEGICDDMTEKRKEADTCDFAQRPSVACVARAELGPPGLDLPPDQGQGGYDKGN